jgi:hypothetical protein
LNVASAAELSSDELEAVSDVMKENVGESFGGLQHTGLGAFVTGCSMPRFKAVGSRRFVQILHQPDHWVCATNVFSDCTHDVFLYDSLFESIESSTVAQVTALLREEDEPDEITFHLRNFKQQKSGTRLCGFYAVAAAFSCCLDVDPTGYFYKAADLQSHLQRCLDNRKLMLFPATITNKVTFNVVCVRKLHCLCQSPSSKNMVQCTYCLNWYHTKCVKVENKQLVHVSMAWRGPCCDTVGHVENVDD